MPDRLSPSTSLRIALLWVMMNALGGGLGFALGHEASSLAPDSMGRTVSDTILFGVFGSLISASQWLVLRTRIAKAGWWVLADSLVWTVLGALARPLERIISLPLRPVIAGLVLGVFQSLVLRRRIRWSGLWVVVSGLGWGLGLSVAGAFEPLVAVAVTDEIIGFAVLYGILTAVYGVFTGPALVVLLGRSQVERSHQE